MVSSQPIPWYNVPAREFPAQTWLAKRYPFIISPASVARLGGLAAPTSGRRFPALVWLEARAGG
ncbi:MAG TPA: hypothetical protein VH590_08325 [Ktedonobacterales bacterium]|jgi:hypothetical protein